MITKLPEAKRTKGSLCQAYCYIFWIDVNICRSQAQFTSALLEYDSAREGFLQLSGDIGGAIWTPIVDYNDLIVEVAMNC